MEIIFEIIAELITGTISEASKSSKVPKPIRYILIALIILFYTAFFAAIFFIGFLVMKDKTVGGIVIIAFGLLMLILCIRKFRKTYLNRK
ncbi:hypothetical protein SAMN02910265_00925 [Ruminococcus flavefaciens]|uniref:Uncharacterized protein n=1 Tax=Ruminococcus flavefaciens TaxID=1265 RepID=A0A1H6ILH5_RUMFL|nr:hypothetical protein [Ruminococcus flavefaciens]SEH47816.1 hypothetical protein SAMN02910265_00925 [Ruminococcus flavefaciens]